MEQVIVNDSVGTTVSVDRRHLVNYFAKWEVANETTHHDRQGNPMTVIYTPVSNFYFISTIR